MKSIRTDRTDAFGLWGRKITQFRQAGNGEIWIFGLICECPVLAIALFDPHGCHSKLFGGKDIVVDSVADHDGLVRKTVCFPHSCLENHPVWL